MIFIIKCRGVCVCEGNYFFFYHLWIPAVRGAWEQPVRDREVMDETRKPKINERRTKQQVGVRNKQTLGLVLHPPAPTAVLYQLLTEGASVYQLVKVYWGAFHLKDVASHPSQRLVCHQTALNRFENRHYR